MVSRTGVVALLACVGLAACVRQTTAQVAVVGDGGPGPNKAQHLTAELTSNRKSIAPGETVEVGLVLTLEEKWHIAWLNGGDRGEPPQIRWVLPKSLTAGALQFPIPSRLSSGSLTDIGYENEVALPVAITASHDLKGASVHLDAEVSWLICESTCVPGRAHMGLDLPVVAHAEPPGPLVGALGEALTLLPKPLSEEMSTDVVASKDEFLLTLHTGTDESEGEFFPSDPHQVNTSAEQTIEAVPDGLRLRLKRADGGATLPTRLRGVVKLNDTEAYAIEAAVRPGVLPPAPSGAQAKVAGVRDHTSVVILALVGVASAAVLLGYRRRVLLR